MNVKEKKLAAKMLNKLSDILGNNSCNDFDFPEDWSKQERQLFIAEYHIENGDPEEFDYNCINLQDFCVADLLADKLREG
jgi:hypothetical protein